MQLLLERRAKFQEERQKKRLEKKKSVIKRGQEETQGREGKRELGVLWTCWKSHCRKEATGIREKEAAGRNLKRKNKEKRRRNKEKRRS